MDTVSAVGSQGKEKLARCHFLLSTGRSCQPGRVSRAGGGCWTPQVQEVLFLALPCLPKFSSLSKLLSQSEGLYFKTERGVFYYFWFYEKLVGEITFYPGCLKWKEMQVKMWLIHFK